MGKAGCSKVKQIEKAIARTGKVDNPWAVARATAKKMKRGK